MEENFEKWVKNNREYFEEDFKDLDQSWDQLEKRMNTKRKFFDKQFLWKAAVFILLGTVSYLLIEKAEKPTPKENPEVSLNQEIREVEEYYYAIISSQKEALQQLPIEEKSVNDMLLKELEKLDSSYLQLKKLYTINQDEQIIAAMVENLQIRMEMLNQQMTLLKNLNIDKNETVNL